MNKTKSYTYFNIGKYLPYIGNKKMFLAISFTHSLVKKNLSICEAMCIAARYYEVNQDTLATWYAQLAYNIKLEKDNAKPNVPETWGLKLTQLEAILLN